MGNYIEPEGTMHVAVSTSLCRRPVNVQSACSSTEAKTTGTTDTHDDPRARGLKDTAITKRIVASTQRLLMLDQESEGHLERLELFLLLIVDL